MSAIDQVSTTGTGDTTTLSHNKRIRQEMHAAGVSQLALGSMEGQYLPRIIHPNEHIKGIVYGHCAMGFVMLIATDRRVIFLDKKPFFINIDELTYDVVSGVEHLRGVVGATIILRTRHAEYHIKTFNERAAQRFVSYLEDHCIECSAKGRGYNP